VPWVCISLQYKKLTCFLPLISFDKSSDTLMNFKSQTSLVDLNVDMFGTIKLSTKKFYLWAFVLSSKVVYM
jgi:hypothetical protein